MHDAHTDVTTYVLLHPSHHLTIYFVLAVEPYQAQLP